MDWILLTGSIVSAWVVLSILANERQAGVIRREREAREAAVLAAPKVEEIPVLYEVGSQR